MSIKESEQDLHISTAEPGFSLRLIGSELQTKNTKLCSIFTFKIPKKQAISFREDSNVGKLPVYRKNSRDPQNNSGLVDNRACSNIERSSHMLHQVYKPQQSITFRNFAGEDEPESDYSSYTEKLFIECLKKRAKSEKMNYSLNKSNEICHELGSVNMDVYSNFDCSISDDEYIDEISLKKRSIAIFEKDCESLATFSEGESYKTGSPVKLKRDSKLRFM